MDKVEHIFFDLDHTLWDFESNSKETLGELYDQHDLQDLGISNKQHFIDRYILINEHYWKLYRENRISKSRLRTVRFETVLKDFGVNDRSLSRKIGVDYLDQCPRKTKLNPGALEVLDALKDHFSMHILSNGFHEVQLVKMKCSGIFDFFDHIITSEKANAKKPSPRIFQYANKVSGTHISESLMIGDNLQIDVLGAHDFGWNAIHYNPDQIEHDQMSIQNLDELVQILLKSR